MRVLHTASLRDMMQLYVIFYQNINTFVRRRGREEKRANFCQVLVGRSERKRRKSTLVEQLGGNVKDGMAREEDEE